MGLCYDDDIVEKLRDAEARVAELEQKLSEPVWCISLGNSQAWLLRKQAEAVEELTEDYEAKVGRGTYIWKGYAVDFSQRLRQQADEIDHD